MRYQLEMLGRMNLHEDTPILLQSKPLHPEYCAAENVGAVGSRRIKKAFAGIEASVERSVWVEPCNATPCHTVDLLKRTSN